MGWVIPVGVPGGVNSGFAGIAAGSGIIRLGGQMLIVERDLYRMWQRAASVPEAQEFLEWADGDGPAGAQDRLQSLLEAGLLLAASGNLAARVARLTISLVGDLLGNGDDPQAFFLVAGRDGARVGVSIHVFELLLRSDGTTAIGTLCDSLDEASGSSPGFTLNSLCAGLPILVRDGVVRLNAGAS